MTTPACCNSAATHSPQPFPGLCPAPRRQRPPAPPPCANGAGPATRSSAGNSTRRAAVPAACCGRCRSTWRNSPVCSKAIRPGAVAASTWAPASADPPSRTPMSQGTRTNRKAPSGGSMFHARGHVMHTATWRTSSPPLTTRTSPATSASRSKALGRSAVSRTCWPPHRRSCSGTGCSPRNGSMAGLVPGRRSGLPAGAADQPLTRALLRSPVPVGLDPLGRLGRRIRQRKVENADRLPVLASRTDRHDLAAG